ncbi:rhomboid-related membrane protein [Geotalea daltonii FRC-32]|uniref:Rhomboid-related membrane protein n=1 Tax=Geotalea daltonii (strain DSM 22248 / JCM 15807 / FRC-32) TaxID=316067 RepID=B9M6B1_GEODF|nr:MULTISPECIES: rhomboid family intramembrane serine protease [Geotalea]ACM21899.1 rhomboid-related membrane protein [Geotalea daltonii FRC-32]
MSQRAMLCPRCRRLIGSSESSCSWCGTPRPKGLWRISAWTRGALDGDWLVKAIITANIAFYLLSLLMGGLQPTGNPFSMLSPNQTGLMLMGATGTIPIDRFGRLWSLVSANYLHGGILHIFFNLMALRQISPWVIQEYGSSRMFIIYTLGGVCGFWVSYIVGVPFTIGASAAICGLIGALLYFGKSRGGTYGAAVYREVSGWVVGLVLFGLVMPGINNWGHGGGILGGIVLGKLLGYGERRRENSFHHLLALICAVTTIAVLGWAAFTAVMIKGGS